MNELKVFESTEFGKVRTVVVDSEPWFVGKDVAEILGYSDTNKAVSMHVDEDDKKLNDKTSPSFGQRGATLINESGLYSLVLSSKLPTAKRFKRWVTSEVIPSIRKHGGYIAGQETMSNEELLSRALLFAQSKIEEKDKIIEAQQEKINLDKPKVDFFDAVADSKTAIAMGEVAKVLGIKGLGRNNLFGLLRKKKVLMYNNMPYQKYVDCGYFRIVEKIYYKPDGDTAITIKTLVYQKGVDYIRKLVEKEMSF